MLIAMSMSTGRIEDSRREVDYSREIVWAGWNPVEAGLQEAASETAGRLIRRHAMPVSMAEMDVDAFISAMLAARR